MKRGYCIKCDSNKIVCIEGSIYDTGNKNYVITGTWGMGKRAIVNRYACLDCGYSEEWIDNQEDLKRLAQKYPLIQSPDTF